MSGNRNRGSRSIARWLAIALSIMLADQLTKQFVLLTIAPGERIAVIPGLFDLTLLFNRGAAFSLLASASGWQRWFFIGVGVAAAVFITWLLFRHAGQTLFATSTGCCTGMWWTFWTSTGRAGTSRRSTSPTAPSPSARPA